ncbi:MAG: tRNA-dihydrouridine synthase [archaeon]|jgi:tRNA-dihydrouridine synthase B
MSFQISKYKFKSRGVLAPILDYSTLPFRLLCKDYGASLTFTEMVHIKQVVPFEKDLSKISSLDSCKDDKVTAVQLVGDFTDRKLTLKAIEVIDSLKDFDIINLNLGCPSGKIIAGNSGSCLIKDLSKVLPVIKEIKSVSNKPVTVKTRLGFYENEINIISKKLISTGIDGLVVHARRAVDNYSVKAEVSFLKKLNKEISIPFIYNGDVSKNNLNLFDDFSAIMVAREALGNPYIFTQIVDYDLQKEIEEYDLEKRKKAFLDFLKIYKKHKIPFPKFKLIVVSFLKDFPKASQLRDVVSKSKNEIELISVIKEELYL